MNKNMQTLLLLLAAVILAVGVLARLYFASKTHPSTPEQAPAQEHQQAPSQ